MEHPADIRHKAQSIDIAPVSEGWCHCGESEGMAVLWPADAKWLVETVERLLDASEGK